ncbi:MAG: FAD-dependent oxidoreductase [Syntrophomonadaceae bacterium]|nr:FAD-dependent oxidoreductase [Syntrophomonadaceae bacterium]
MKRTEIAVIGAGPAGLSAARSAAAMGAAVTLIDRNMKPGGQLVKQTHAFFGSEKEYASVRGIDIAGILCRELAAWERVELMFNATVLGYYQDDGVLGIERDGKFLKLKADTVIIATGASEKTLAFPNNDLPGVYGAGAAQTLMNEHGVMPGRRVLMVGAGNIGLIVSYQMLQAGVQVAAIIDAAPKIGGYLVHAAKVRRLGIPILVSHSIKAAHGQDGVEGATVWQLDATWAPVPGTERFLEVDVICIAVGLSPLAELLWQAGCRMRYVPELGGHVPIRTEALETTVPGIFVAGDVAGVEEASSAMVEGRLAGLSAAARLGYQKPEFADLYREAQQQLASLRSGPVGAKIRAGLARLA